MPSAVAYDTSGYSPLNKLFYSDPFTSQYDGQVLENLEIYVANSNPVTLNHRVVFRNSRIHFLASGGLVVNAGAAGSDLSDLNILHSALPASIATALPASDIGIYLNGCDGISLRRIKTRGGASAIYANGVERLLLETIQGANIYGDSSHGNFIYALNCPGMKLRNFTCLNPYAYSRPQDIVKLSGCDGASINNGLLDGNNCPTGYGLNIHDSSNVQVDDVEIAHMGNGSVGVTGGYNNRIRAHVRDTYTTDQGRGAPSSPGRAFFSLAGTGAVSMTVFDRCTYANLATTVRNKIIDDETTCAIADFTAKTKTAKSLLDLQHAWEYSGRAAPYLLALQGPSGTGTPTISTQPNPSTGTVIGLLYAESDTPADMFTYTLVDGSDGKFYLSGNQVKSKATFNYNIAHSHTIVVDVAGSNNLKTRRSFVIPVASGLAAAVNTITLPNANAIVTDAPTLGTFTIGVSYPLVAIAITGDIQIDSAAMGQRHTVTAQAIVSDAPDVPTLPITAFDIITDVPTIGTFTITQQHVLTAVRMDLDAYYITFPNINPLYGVDITTDVPTIASFIVGQEYPLVPTEIGYSADATLGAPTVTLI